MNETRIETELGNVVIADEDGEIDILFGMGNEMIDLFMLKVSDTAIKAYVFDDINNPDWTQSFSFTKEELEEELMN